MTILESLKSYLTGCPYLEELSGIMGVDFLPDRPESLSVEPVPSKTVLRDYVDGSSERQFVFVLAARLAYTDEIRNNIDNSGLFEKIEEWMEVCTASGALPDLGSGRIATKIEALSSGYLFGLSPSMTDARYQIQCRLLYDKEAIKNDN